MAELGWTETRVGPGGLNDCAVRAWSIATGIDYSAVLTEMQRHDDLSRRRPVDIQQRGTQIAAMRRFAAAHGWRWQDASGSWEGSVYQNPAFVASELPEGSLVAITERHAVAVRDYTLLDEYDSRNNSGCLLGWFYQAS